MKNAPSKRKSPAHVAWLKKKNAQKNTKHSENGHRRSTSQTRSENGHRRSTSQTRCEEPPLESFRDMEICPSPDELLGIEKLPVRKNIVRGSYENAEDYLDLQFRLLREDFVRPLREALAEVRGRDESIENPLHQGAKVYKGVRFEKLLKDCHSLSILVKVDPDQINLANEKLFMYGSLLCFSQSEDNFQNVVLAKVCTYFPNCSRKGLIRVSLINPDELLDIVFGASYSMFESEVFFEPYFRVLTALQSMALDGYPMCKYVTGEAKVVQTINQMRWGPNDNPGLNSSQFKGYCSALTNNLTLIQGPPGTGKTFVGLKVVKRMIELNEELEMAGAERPPPILVICATNHALDQFLEHIVGVCTDVIRVGGQSQSVILADYTMTAKRKLYRETNRLLSKELLSIEQNMNKLRKDIEKKVRKLNEEKLTIDEQTELEDEILVLVDKFHEQTKEYQGCKLEKDLVVMRDARLIGMTTTSAARLRPLLDHLQPSIMIVEEAAEVLEGHIVGALTRHCRHVVLIGDHQQLRPITSCYRLSKEYRLDVSLFERLCTNGLRYFTLETQHRMRPEFAQLLVPTVYRVLFNDASVLNRPNVTGVDKNMFFVNHMMPEESAGWSKKNMHEAEFLMALCQYLILQGNAPAKITIIAMYAAQVTELENLRAKHVSLNDVVISSVDGYQGEENDIVLLSLVRSNKSAHIGFLWTVNRVCVALSRARFGLYIIGNMENLTRDKRSVWCRINRPMTVSRIVGTHLPLRCSVHGTLLQVSCAADFPSDATGCGLGCTSKPRPGSLESLLNVVTLDDKPLQTKVYTNGNFSMSSSMQDILDGIERQPPRKLTPPGAGNGPKKAALTQGNKNPAPTINAVRKPADAQRGLPKPVSQVAPTKTKHFFAADFEPEPLLKPQAAVTPFRKESTLDEASSSDQKPQSAKFGSSCLATKPAAFDSKDKRDPLGRIQKEMEEFDRQTIARRNELLARVLEQRPADQQLQPMSSVEHLNQSRTASGSIVATAPPETRNIASTSVIDPIQQNWPREENARHGAGAQVVARGFDSQPDQGTFPSAPQMDFHGQTGAIPRTRLREAPQPPRPQPAAPTPVPRTHVPQTNGLAPNTRLITTTTVQHHIASTRPLGVTRENHFADTRVHLGQDALLIGEHRRQWPQAAPPVVEKPKKKTCAMM